VVFSAMLILLMYLAPFGFVGLAKRLGRRVVLVVPRPPTGTAGDEPAPEVAPDDVAPSPFETAVPSPTQGRTS
jgi:hypothetical protein